MNIEKLNAKKQELIELKAMQVMSETDKQEIAAKVANYEVELIKEKNNEFEENKKTLDAQLDLLDQLIEDEQSL